MQVPFPHGCRSHSSTSAGAKPPSPIQLTHGIGQRREGGPGRTQPAPPAPSPVQVDGQGHLEGNGRKCPWTYLSFLFCRLRPRGMNKSFIQVLRCRDSKLGLSVNQVGEGADLTPGQQTCGRHPSLTWQPRSPEGSGKGLSPVHRVWSAEARKPRWQRHM